MSNQKFYVFVSFPNTGNTLATTYASTKFEAEDRIFRRYAEKMPNRKNYNAISFQKAKELFENKKISKAIHIAKS